MSELLFGAAYYDEYAQTERLERDMALMREAGMNTIRIAESTWSVEEPRCGEFDFSHVTRTIEAAAKYGIRVIIGTPTYAIPKRLADLDPSIPGRNLYGPRQNMKSVALDTHIYIFAMFDMLHAWQEESAKLERGEIDREEYDRWRYRYPELDTAARWASVPSEALSDAIVEELKKE